MELLENNILTKEFKDDLTLDLDIAPAPADPLHIDSPVIIDFDLKVCKMTREDGTKINVRTVSCSSDASLAANVKLYNPYAYRMLKALRDKYGCSQFNMVIASRLTGLSLSCLNSESFKKGFMTYKTWRLIYDAITTRFGEDERWFTQFCELLVIHGRGYHPKRRYATRNKLTVTEFDVNEYVLEKRQNICNAVGSDRMPVSKSTYFQAKETDDMGYFISTDFNRNSVTHSIGENDVDVTNKEDFVQYIENWLDHETTIYRGALWASQGAVSISSHAPVTDASEQVHMMASDAEPKDFQRYHFEGGKYVSVMFNIDVAHDALEYALLKQTENLTVNQLNDVFSYVVSK